MCRSFRIQLWNIFVVYIVEASAQLIPFSENLSHHPPRKLIFRGKKDMAGVHEDRNTGCLSIVGQEGLPKSEETTQEKMNKFDYIEVKHSCIKKY